MARTTHLISNPTIIRPTLYGEMGRLQSRIDDLAHDEWDSVTICEQIASEFDLFAFDGSFPAWLATLASESIRRHNAQR